MVDVRSPAEGEEPIFLFGDEPITQSSFKRALREIGIREGDIVFVQSDLLSFGRLVMKDGRAALSLLTAALREAVGADGTVIMPTFTYSFIDERWSGPPEDFDVDRSRSKTGALTEHFRKEADVIRTDHPTHSVAIAGTKRDFISDVGNTTFGKDSVFDKLFASDAKIVCLGWGNGGPMGTFHHYIERQVGVPYRTDVALSGSLVRDGRVSQKEIRFYQKDRNISLSLERFRQRLLSADKVRQVRLGGGVISAIGARALFDEGVQALQEDPYAFVSRRTRSDEVAARIRRLIKRAINRLKGVASLHADRRPESSGGV